MKRIILYLIIAIVASAALFCIFNRNKVKAWTSMSYTAKDAAASVTDSLKKQPAKNGKRVLVAYFSWGGNTRKLAQSIHQQIGGDIVEIRMAKAYPSSYMACVKAAKAEIDSHQLPAITTKVDLNNYDVIILGYPIWYYREPLAIDTFLKQNNVSGKLILPFATSGGSTIDGSLAGLKEVAPQAQLGEGILITEQAQVAKWLQRNGML